jgi:hypothetical protein
MADSQVSQYRRENEQRFGGYFSDEDLDACFEPDEEPEPEEDDEVIADYRRQIDDCEDAQ